MQNNETLIGGDLGWHLLGDRVPTFVSQDKNAIATIVFAGSDLKYDLDLNTIHANSYWGKLINAQQTKSTVKIYVAKDTKIVRVE